MAETVASINCPYCDHVMALKGVRPGRFTPSCRLCTKKFTLVVPEDPTKQPIATALSNAAPAAPASADVTAPPAPRPAPPPRQTSATATVAPTPQPAAPPPRSAAVTDAGPAPLSAADREVTGALGGYVVLKRIGKGGMGSVYLAKQVSLDRNVAVKVMNQQWAHDPEFVARFTREAYAAAQLVHHNVVQIHDIGAQDDTHYFSMEFVDGESLSGVLAKAGKLDPEVAAGYVLQAARALKFAHDAGMIHRDIKPDNLLLNAQGIVKVADLGLVKTPTSKDKTSGLADPKASANTTMANASMGTPAYIAPEQAADASKVDGRADIYSLGCTLYDLVTGRPPFTGKTAIEVMSKHATEPLTPPERIAERVPPVLSKVIQKMMAKKPEDRYQKMDEVIKALESFLGVESSGPFSPREEHAKVLETSIAKFNASPKAKLRRLVVRGFFALCVVLIAALAATNHPLWAGAFLGLAVLTTLSYIVVTGVTQKTFLFTRLRQFVFDASVGDWAMGVFAIAVLLFALHIFGLLWSWVAFCVVAVGLAIALHATLDLLAARERRGQIEDVETMLKGMRLRGLEEDSLRQFVCKYSGNHWEEFYEALFGYEAKMEARERWGRGDRGKMRKKHGAWRDALVRAIDQKLRARQERKEKKVLQAVEEKELKAQGLDAAAARAKAQDRAEAMVGKAAEFKDAAAMRSADTLAPGATPARPQLSASYMTEVDDAAAHRDKARKRAGRGGMGGLLGLFVGSRTRFVLGAALLAICFLWLQQNELLTWPPDFHKAGVKPLEIMFVPSAVTAKLFNSLAVGVAGVVLLMSILWRRLGVGVVIIAAAVVILAGPLIGVPPLLGWDAARTSVAAGGLLAALVYAFAPA